MNESIVTIVFALGVVYAVGVAIAFAHGADIRNGDNLRRTLWYSSDREASTAELDRERVKGTRLMLIAPFWPVTLVVLVVRCGIKIIKVTALQAWKISASVARIINNAVTKSKP